MMIIIFLFHFFIELKNVGAGSGALGQVWLGTFDMTLHDNYDRNGDMTSTDVLKELTIKRPLVT